MAKFTKKEIERAKRSVLVEMLNELGIEFDESLKNDELREILIKNCSDEQEPQEEPNEETTQEFQEEPQSFEADEQVVQEAPKEIKVETSIVSEVIRKRKLDTKTRKEVNTTSVASAIRNRRGITSSSSIAEVIRQRRFGKK